MVHTEDNNQDFSLQGFLNLQQVTIELVESVSQKVEAGMNYLDIENLINQHQSDYGIVRSWHPTKVRIGRDTLLAFPKKSDPRINISSGDIYFIDIGTVKNGLEGDVGRSYLLGKNDKSQEVIDKCKLVFDDSISAWKNQNLSGKNLYEFAFSRAKKYGLELNLSMDGHRIGSYPHGLHFKGGLGEIDFCPNENLWILEIQVKCPKLNIGAFYEDIIR